LEDVFAKLGEKFGDLTGRVETKMRSTVTFDDVGGLREPKTGLKGFALALSNPDLYRSWGIDPPKGVLLYGPPGTGKSKLAQDVAEDSSRVLSHPKVRREHRRSPPGDSPHRDGRGAGGAVPRRGRGALPRAPAPAAPGA